MHRFSRDKRFLEVSFEQFLATTKEVTKSLSRTRPGLSATFVTCEDLATYAYSTDAFVWRDKNRSVYTLEQFTKSVWDKSYSIHLTLKDETTSNSFTVWVSIDRVVSPKSIFFYGQNMSDATLQAINLFARRSLFWGIGDGFPKT